MPIHDWTRVDESVLRSFHLSWTGCVKSRLNAGLLPTGYYALVESVTPPPRDGFAGPTIGELLRCGDDQRQEVDVPILVGESIGWSAVVIRTEREDEVVRVIELPLRPEPPFPDMPVFLRPGACVMLPLEETYMSAYHATPLRWRRVIEGQ